MELPPIRAPVQSNAATRRDQESDVTISPGSRPQILLVEDDAGAARAACDALVTNGYEVSRADNLQSGRSMITSGKFDAVVLDLTLPDGDGLEFARFLRGGQNEVPILMLTARDTVLDRVEGFRHGADDYLCKPFDAAELVARLSAILRRTRAAQRHILHYADVEFDLINRSVRRGRRQATLSIREAGLLAYLMRHPEEVLPRDRILEQVWGDEAEEDSNVLNVYVNYLRNKLEGATHSRLIHTVRGTGYILSERDPEAGA